MCISKKIFILELVLVGLLDVNVYAADIPYCSGTIVTGTKHTALQKVVSSYASALKLKIGKNCLLEVNKVTYSIAWGDPKGGNGSSFICSNGQCSLENDFHLPMATYNQDEDKS